MRRGAAILTGAVSAIAMAVLAAAFASTALAQPISPYDGRSPFNCQLQDVGTGTDFPDPDADPFCVEFDKTQQNVTDLGIVDFLSKEPARVAAAAPKCFYFQRDHWTGSIVQGAPPELWHWDGSYFFDKAAGTGGSHLANFRLGGQPMDGTPYAPPEFQPYMEPGGAGGAQIAGVVSDPSCAAMVDTPSERAQVYYHEMPGGPVTYRRIGPFALRQRRAALHAAHGPAHETLQGSERYNVTGGGQLRLAYGDPPRRGAEASAAGQEPVAAILTTSASHSRRSVSPGDPGPEARRALGATFAFGLGELRVYEAPRRERRRLLLGIRSGTLEWLAIADRRGLPTGQALKRALRLLSRSGPGRVDSTGMPW